MSKEMEDFWFDFDDIYPDTHEEPADESVLEKT